MPLTRPDESMINIAATSGEIDNVESDLSYVESKYLGDSITGLEISIGTDAYHDVEVSPGICRDSTGNYLMDLTSTLTKKLDSLWEAGDLVGGLDHSHASTVGTTQTTTFSDDLYYHKAVSALSSTKAIVCYCSTSVTQQAHARILNINGDIVTFGPSIIFDTEQCSQFSIATLSPTKVIASYRGNSSHTRACVLDISGDIITYGTPVEVYNGGATNETSISTLTSTKAIIAYTTDIATNDGHARVLDIDGTTITVGTQEVFTTHNIDNVVVTTLTSTKAFVAYRNKSFGFNGTGCILTISGSSVSAGTPVYLSDDFADFNSISITTLTSTKVLLAYSDDGLPFYVYARVVDIDGDIITPGNAITIRDDSTYEISVSAISDNKAIVVYQLRISGSNGPLVSRVLDIDGRDITMGPLLISDTAETNYYSTSMLSSTKIIAVYSNTDNTTGQSVVLTAGSPTANTNYYPWLIRKDSDGTTDVVLSSNAVSISAPDGYSYERKIPYTIVTDSTANIDRIILENTSIGKGYIYGLEISNNSIDPEHDVNISIGKCKDSTDNYLLELTSGLTKQLDAPWAVGTNAGGIVHGNTIEAGTSADFLLSAVGLGGTSMASLTDTQAIVVFRGVSNYGSACTLNVTGSTVTAGAVLNIESRTMSNPSIAKLTDTTAIAVYAGGDGPGRACVLTTSGTTLIPGTPFQFADGHTRHTRVVALSSTRVLVAYADYDDSYKGKAIILDVSGSVITPQPSSLVVFESVDSTEEYALAALSSTKAVISYVDFSNSDRGKACVLDIDGINITAGTPVVFETNAIYEPDITMLSDTRAIVAYRDTTASGYGKARILDVSGNIVTVRNPLSFNETATQDISITTLTESKAIITYSNGGAYQGRVRILDVYGNMLIPGMVEEFNAAATHFIRISKLTSTKAIVSYSDYGDSNHGKSCVIDLTAVPVANTFYYAYLIRKDSDGSIDAVLSSSSVSPILPSNYTYSRRIRGAILTDGSANIFGFRQKDDNFRFSLMKYDVANLDPGTDRVLATMSVPPNMIGKFSYKLTLTSVSNVIFQETSDTNQAPDSNYLNAVTASNSANPVAEIELKTDSSSQIAYRCSNGATDVYIWTLGFVDQAQD